MKFLFANWDYETFIDDFHARRPGLAERPYAVQHLARRESLFGMADFYSRNLRRLGHDSEDIFVNHPSLQKQWALENGVRVPADPVRRIPYVRRFVRPWFMHVALEQVKKARPDVLYIMCMGHFDPALLKEVRPYVRLIVGQHASPLPRFPDLSGYDFVLSSLPNLVRHFHERGLRSRHFRLGFEDSILDGFRGIGRTIPLSFIGGLSAQHRDSIELLEHLSRHTEIAIWGYGAETLPSNSPIRERYRGYAFGSDMYRILCASKISINRHITVAGTFANNMRLYEATGCGALLLTDRKENLGELFDVEREVATYGDKHECLSLVQSYAGRDAERDAMAVAGQRKTLSSHTYRQRAEELLEILAQLL